LSWLKEEERLVKDFIDGRIPILQTAVLLYRVLRSIAAQESSTQYKPGTLLRNQVENLQAHETNMSNNERNHTRVVISLVKRMIHGRTQLVKEREQTILSSFSVDYMTKTISRIKTNGFSVCNGESIALGVGIFAEASNMNHSCRPNALHTFSYARPGVLPTIRITACTTISSGDEICISYIDNGCPRDIRRKSLQEGYHFWCTCSFCLDDSHDDYIIGMRCPKTGCHGMGQRTSHFDAKPEYKCKCGNVDFFKGTELMKAFHVNDRSKMSYNERENLYTTFRLSFFASSWFVCESGEELAQSLLDGIDGCDEHESQRLCARALSVLNEVLAASASDNDPGRVLRNHVLLYKIAKLRLFLYPDPTVALAELQRTKEVLSRYYPIDHEFLQGLENTVSQAMH
jgi:SET and MYND domain-containing protein